MTPGGWIWNYRGYAPLLLMTPGGWIWNYRGVCPPTTNNTWWMDLELQWGVTPGGLYQLYNRFLGFHFTKLLHLYCLKIMEDGKSGSFGFFGGCLVPVPGGCASPRSRGRWAGPPCPQRKFREKKFERFFGEIFF